ncbi:unnamed protein product [Closterium sp. NIES-54]
MSLRPSTAPLRAPLPSPPESSLPALADPESDSLRAASPTVPRLLSTVVTDPSFESTAVSALVAEVVDFAARCRLDYAASLVAESESVCPPSVGGLELLTSLPSPPESSLPALADPESDSLRAARPTVPRLLSTVVTDCSFESTAVSALVAEVVDFAARCRLDYAASLVAESESVCPPSVGGECALGTDVLEDRQEEFKARYVSFPAPAPPPSPPPPPPWGVGERVRGGGGCASAAAAAAMPSPLSRLHLLLWGSGGEGVRGWRKFFVRPAVAHAAPALPPRSPSPKPLHLQIHSPPLGAPAAGGWRRKGGLGGQCRSLLGDSRVREARYVARGFSQRQGVDYFQTFSPTPKMTTLQVLLHVAAHRDYERTSSWTSHQ